LLESLLRPPISMSKVERLVTGVWRLETGENFTIQQFNNSTIQ